MNLRTILGLLITLITCSCTQKTSEKVGLVNDDCNMHSELLSSLKIENRINRGARFTDSDSINYWLIHIASTFTNNSSIPIQVKLTFSNDYNYPTECEDQKFKLILLPNLFAVDSVAKVKDNQFYTDNMQVELRDYLENGINPLGITKNVQPGESWIISIGAKYAESFDCAVIPNLLLLQSDLVDYQDCANLLDQEELNSSELALGLKIDFRTKETDGRCKIITCGQVSYPEHYNNINNRLQRE